MGLRFGPRDFSFFFLVFMIRSGFVDFHIGANYLILFVTFFRFHLFDKKKGVI